MTRGTVTEAAGVLAAARRARAEADAAEVRVLLDAVSWAALHEVTDLDDAATWGDTPVMVAGAGAPQIGEFCVAEFAAAVGVSTESGRFLLAHALEIAHRLPCLWRRVRAGDLPVWRARRIAEQTISLSAEAAAYVDQQIAPYAHKSGPVVTERLVDEATARFMPEEAAEIAARAAEARYVSIDHDQVSFAGTSRIHGELDLADALDLQDALIRGAETLKAAGSHDSLDVRRAAALGVLARGQDVLPLVAEDAPPTRTQRPRDLTLYVHLDADQVSTSPTNSTSTHGASTNGGAVTVEGHRPLTVEQIRTWCATPGAQITIKPVLDLHEQISTPTYAIPDRLRDQVILRDRTCVFPWCTRNARSCDLDHVIPYAAGGTTSSENLAPLCRRHHRLKTHSPWTYTVTNTPPGTRGYRWHSPHGHTYLRTTEGTQDLTPRPVTPPG